MCVAVCVCPVLMRMLLAIVVPLLTNFVFVFVFVGHLGSLAFWVWSCAKLAQKRRFLQGMSIPLVNFTRKLRSLLVK